LLEDQRSRLAVEITEQFVDGGATKRQLKRAARGAFRAYNDAMHAFLRKKETAITGAWTPLGAALTAMHASSKKADFIASTTDANCEEQAVLACDIFGNPFRPVTISPAVLAWNDAVVVRLAQATYEERHLPEGTLDSGRLAILADALEEAGCTDTDIPGHLRRSGPHVRGCWPVDLCLGKF
jgi:hypothetical protein